VLIIGEKINATIPKVKEAIRSHDAAELKKLAADQESAGAHLIDINVGTGEGSSQDEIDNMEWIVKLVRDNISGSICIDSADVKVLEAGLNAGKDRIGMVNSVKATDSNIAEVLPLSSQHGVPVIGLAMDEQGIPREVSQRLKACEKIIKGAEQFGIPPEHIYFDPLVMPISTDNGQGRVTLDTLREIKKEFPKAKTILALSNISFGLPKRSLVNRSLLQMAMYLNVDAALVDPLDATLMATVKAGDVVLGRDRHCRKYTRAFRQGILH
jgi:5-methyltetrahydrofolate--homocysteine methyltransferase